MKCLLWVKHRCNIMSWDSPECQHPDGDCRGPLGGKTGWIPFWTPAERAGLKAMGYGTYSIVPRWQIGLTEQEITINDGQVEIIRAYVQAARKAKEQS
jgi:hypothetical protein